MADEQGLRAILDADAKKFDAVLKNSVKVAKETAAGIRDAGRQFDSLTPAVTKGESTLGKFNVTGRNAGQVATNLGRIVSDLPFGFIAIQNNIDPLIASLGGPAGLALAFTITGAAVTTLVQKYGSLGNAYDALTGQTTELQRLQKQFNEETFKSAGAAQSEIALVNGYIAVAKDEAISRDQRNKAIKEAQELYPGYLDNINLENVNSQSAATAIDRLSSSLIRKAKIQGAQNIIAEQQEKLLRAENTSLSEQLTLWDKLATAMTSFSLADAATQLTQRARLNQVNSIIDATKATQKFQDVINSLLKEEAIDKVLGFGKKSQGVKQGRDLSSVLQELQKDLVGLETAFVSIGGNPTSLIIDKLQRLERALKDVSEFGVKPGSEVFLSLDNTVKQLQNSLNRTPVSLQIPVTIQPIPKASNSGTVSAVKQAVSEFKEIEQFFNQVQKNFNSALSSGASNFASGFGDLAGKVISGSATLADAFKGVIGLFGSFIKQLGESLIASGTAMLAAKILIKNPLTAIAAGVIAVAAGAAIQNSMNKVPSFATGGTVYGPQLIAAGDNTTQKEHILSDMQLQKIAEGAGIGSGGEIIAESFISGNQLAILLKRAGYQISRIN